MATVTKEPAIQVHSDMLASKSVKKIKHNPATVFTYLAGCTAFGNMIGGFIFNNTIWVAVCALAGLVAGLVLLCIQTRVRER